jgi:hypothetical protein
MHRDVKHNSLHVEKKLRLLRFPNIGPVNISLISGTVSEIFFSLFYQAQAWNRIHFQS